TARAVFGRAGDGAGRAGAAPGDRSRPPSRGLRSDQCRTRPPPRGGRRRAMLILELVLNGILLGALYACVGISFSLIWGVMNIISLAHGSMIMLGAYVAFFLFSALGLNPFLAIPVSGGVLFVIGYAVQRYVINLVIR